MWNDTRRIDISYVYMSIDPSHKKWQSNIDNKL